MIKAGKFSYAQPILPTGGRRNKRDNREDSFFHYKRLGSVQYQESEEDHTHELAKNKQIVDVKFPDMMLGGKF